jgi:hypothetical protein
LTLYSGVQVHVVDSSTFMPTLFDKNLIPWNHIMLLINLPTTKSPILSTIMW